MYYVTKIDDGLATTPLHYLGSCEHYAEQRLINRSTGSPHMGVSIGHLAPRGFVEPVVHSFEVSMYVFSGRLALTMQGATTLLSTDHCVVIPLARPTVFTRSTNRFAGCS